MSGIDQRDTRDARLQPSGGPPSLPMGRALVVVVLVMLVLVPVGRGLTRLVTEGLGWSAWVAVGLFAVLAAAAWRLRRSSRTPWLTDASFAAMLAWVLALLDAATLATGVDAKAIAAGVVVVVWAWHGIRYLRNRWLRDPVPDHGTLDHPRDDDPSRGRGAPH